jgi:alpha-tubulin suppressor-like RCC1 family protein
MTQVSAGEYFTLALKSDGTVWAWGSGTSGQLGNGGTSNSYTPVEVQASSGVNFTGVVAVAAAGYTAYAIKSDGSLWAWGRNGDGEIGDNTYTQRNYPVEVLTSGVAQVVGAYYNVAALKTDGTVWCWGQNTCGQNGHGTTSYNDKVPTQVTGLTGITQVGTSPGAYEVAALKNDGTVWAWGLNSYGGLGNGTTTQEDSAVEVQASSGVNFTGAVAITTGAYHLVIETSNSTIWSSGLNSSGQLGNNSTTNSSYPVEASSFLMAMLKDWSHRLGLDRYFAWEGAAASAEPPMVNG